MASGYLKFKDRVDSTECHGSRVVLPLGRSVITPWTGFQTPAWIVRYSVDTTNQGERANLRIRIEVPRYLNSREEGSTRGHDIVHDQELARVYEFSLYDLHGFPMAAYGTRDS